MNIYSIILQNQIITKQDLDINDIQNYLEKTKGDGITRKYPINIFYALSSLPQDIDSIQKNYTYALKNMKVFLETSKQNYSLNDISNLALLYAIKNCSFTLDNYREGIKVIDSLFKDVQTENELGVWCQEEIKLFRLHLFSFDVENYENGLITSLLGELKNVIENHKEELIYANEIN